MEEFLKGDIFFIIALMWLYLIVGYMVYQFFLSDGTEKLWHQGRRWNQRLPRFLRSNWEKSNYVSLLRTLVAVLAALSLIASLTMIWERWLSRTIPGAQF